MKTQSGTAIPTLLLALAVMACLPELATNSWAADEKPLVVFLVRHGEKADLSKDAELSAAGRERAYALAETLRDAKIESVHSSNFIRTRDTARPTAGKFRLPVRLYDPGDLPALVEKLRARGGRHLVVGHSNTTPEMAKLLGGEPVSEINEAGEFDRLYIVTIGKDGAASVVLLRYGKAYEPKEEE